MRARRLRKGPASGKGQGAASENKGILCLKTRGGQLRCSRRSPRCPVPECTGEVCCLRHDVATHCPRRVARRARRPSLPSLPWPHCRPPAWHRRRWQAPCALGRPRPSRWSRCGASRHFGFGAFRRCRRCASPAAARRASWTGGAGWARTPGAWSSSWTCTRPPAHGTRGCPAPP